MSSQLHSESLKILRFWRDLEFFVPFDLDQVIEHERAILLHCKESRLLPWEAPREYELDEAYEYGFDLYLLPFLKSQIVAKLAAVLPGILEESPPDPREFEGVTCLMRVSVSGGGSFGDARVSTLPWALQRLTQREPLSLADFDAFSELTQAIFAATARTSEAEQESIHAEKKHSVESLSEFTRGLGEKLALELFPEHLLAVVVAHPLRKKKQPSGDELTLEEEDEIVDLAALDFEVLRRKRKVDILNSFFLRDLERCYEQMQNGKEAELSPLGAILRAPFYQGERVDIVHADGACTSVDRANSAQEILGRWPTEPEKTLSRNQRIAVNYYFDEAAPSLQAINGPPGTGKTTVIRDLIAEVVVERARRLAKLKSPLEAFHPAQYEITQGRSTYRYRRLRQEFEGLEFVVASSNNAAVENISKELPRTRSLAETMQHARFLKPTAELLRRMSSASKEAGAGSQTPELSSVWGLPSVALGNRRNRMRFLQSALFGPRGEEAIERARRIAEGEALTLFEWRKRAPESALSFRAARAEFLSASVLVQELSSDDEGSARNTARNELFLAALQLQEAWVREVPRFENELSTLGALLKNPQMVSSADARALWALLFMVTPVVSTTLA